ncbi:MAG: TrkA family potassium uptake protein [Dermatophilaceae bacterium]
MAKRQHAVLVVGLGRFGGAAALELNRLGHQVVAVEKDPETAREYAGRLTRVVHADATRPHVIAELKVDQFPAAVVGIGFSVEASVLAAANLVDAGVPSIWAKALSPEHGRILERIGVHKVIFPEAQTGRRVAHLVGGGLLDYLEVDEGFVIVTMSPPQETVGFTLAQSNIRQKYGVTVVGVKGPGREFVHAQPDTKITAHDILIVTGPTTLMERFAARP